MLSTMLWARAGGFGTAFLHEYIGRDPRIGGLIGTALGFFFGPLALAAFWIWLYYSHREETASHVIKTRRRWYDWWRP